MASQTDIYMSENDIFLLLGYLHTHILLCLDFKNIQINHIKIANKFLHFCNTVEILVKLKISSLHR